MATVDDTITQRLLLASWSWEEQGGKSKSANWCLANSKYYRPCRPPTDFVIMGEVNDAVNLSRCVCSCSDVLMHICRVRPYNTISILESL